MVLLRGNSKGDIYNRTKTPNYTLLNYPVKLCRINETCLGQGSSLLWEPFGVVPAWSTVKVPVLSRLLVLKLGGEKITCAFFWFKEGSSYGVLVTNFLDMDEIKHPWWIYWNYMTCMKRVWLVWALITAVWKDEWVSCWSEVAKMLCV